MTTATVKNEKQMYTPALLLEMASKAEEEYERLLKIYPPGTINDERNDAHRLMEQALFCAEWMEKNGYQELANVGPFVAFELIRGQKVKIMKGAVIHSTHPSIPREGIVLQRAQTIVVHSFSKGYVDQGYLRRDSVATVEQGRVTWAGTGGYWKWTDINNVEV